MNYFKDCPCSKIRLCYTTTRNDSDKELMKSTLIMTGNPLKVLEAYTRDVGRGVCRIDYESMDS